MLARISSADFVRTDGRAGGVVLVEKLPNRPLEGRNAAMHAATQLPCRQLSPRAAEKNAAKGEKSG